MQLKPSPHPPLLAPARPRHLLSGLRATLAAARHAAPPGPGPGPGSGQAPAARFRAWAPLRWQTRPSPRMVLLPADGASRRLRWRGPLQLTAVTGPVWITREGWPQDHWLAPGERLTLLPDPGRQGLALWIGTLGVVGEPHITLKLEPIV